ncbi:MAG: hypothetical protein KDA24_09330 [Deltaproteobacteria bacterium]|nr:hypothetical protein [Deltaproteobacteria bacterium]
MRSILLSTLLALPLLAGCPSEDTELPPPPDFVGDSDLNLYLFGAFDAEDPVEMQQGVEALDAQLATVDLVGDQSGRRWDGGEFLTEDDHGGATIWDGAQPLDQLVITVAGQSVHPVIDHASLIPIPDQTPFESSSSAAYDRTLISDGDCFVGQTCDRLETMNTVHRQNILVNITYDTPKFFRWVELSDGRDALVARAWLEEPFTGANGNNTFEQFTALEVRIDDGEGGAIVYTTIWGDLKPSPGDLVSGNTTANGIDEGWENTDAWLTAN